MLKEATAELEQAANLYAELVRRLAFPSWGLHATGGTVFGSNLQPGAQPPQRSHLPSWSETQLPEFFSSPASSY